MTIIFLDTETTGLKQAEGDQIIELCAILLDGPDAARRTHEYRIKPTKAISADSREVHGISDADLAGCNPWSVTGPEIRKALFEPYGGSFVIAHNVAFDVPFLTGEFNRIGLPGVLNQTYCTMENSRWACFDGKPPRLQELCFALGVFYDPAQAHRAMYDTEVMVACYLAGLKRGVYPDLF